MLPLESLPELRILVFEEVHFSTREICRWLFIQPKLKNLILLRPYLHDHWKDLVKKWSEDLEFVPWDHDNKKFEEGDEDLKIPARVSSTAILKYINNGGANPFDNRRWRVFERDPDAEADHDGINDYLSDYSDMSEWRPIDHPEPIEDFDRPEFDEDYDFDAEEIATRTFMVRIVGRLAKTTSAGLT
ncbi:uncharacterized protein Z518_07205 [Rhinocladiella mackenziei CBS 650.93]|uniref:Uncharacterized protein n=1 Tax=Rhinocladiella mackenziei CBS 650.93 TaxID=1442369 RepID=A0A0D2FNL2_9EURO|nr:uncharacterized protein Z518_07205 [Rhinocladiella mackenziei CBS 650.93]KIX03652.1 hypothetical protein Z518_07205 [Rhinocladiella mackenziei CBS 650.93]